MRAWSLENVLLSYYYRNHKMIIICSLRKSRGGSQSSQGSVPFSATPLTAKKLGNQFFNVWLRHEAVIETHELTDLECYLLKSLFCHLIYFFIPRINWKMARLFNWHLIIETDNWPWKVNIWIIKRVAEITLINTWSLSVLCLRLY